MEDNQLFCEFQSAYRTGHSCETALACIHNDLLCNEVSHNFLFVLLDLSAAFDTLNHNQLLSVLEKHYGLTDNVLKWLFSYLDSRTYLVKIIDVQSKPQNLQVAVPQGSILGLMLFILFTKELQDVVIEF